MKNKGIFMLGLCLMAVSLSGCIIIADNSPKPTSVSAKTSSTSASAGN
jgi:hypothetical protein